jgi:hypothetical protein
VAILRVQPGKRARTTIPAVRETALEALNVDRTVIGIAPEAAMAVLTDHRVTAIADLPTVHDVTVTVPHVMATAVLAVRAMSDRDALVMVEPTASVRNGSSA